MMPSAVTPVYCSEMAWSVGNCLKAETTSSLMRSECSNATWLSEVNEQQMLPDHVGIQFGHIDERDDNETERFFREVFDPIDLGEEMRGAAADGHTRKSTSRRIDGRRIAWEHADRFRLYLSFAQGRGKRGKTDVAGRDRHNIQSQAGTTCFEQARQAVCIDRRVGRIDHKVELRRRQFAQTGQKTLRLPQIARQQPYTQ